MNEQNPLRPTEVFVDIADAPTLEHKPRTINVDVEKFQHRLDGCDMTDAEKAEYLHLIWSIILEFIDLGYGVHPVQEFCGQVQESAGHGASQDGGVVNSGEQSTSMNQQTASNGAGGDSEDS